MFRSYFGSGGQEHLFSLFYFRKYKQARTMDTARGFDAVALEDFGIHGSDYSSLDPNIDLLRDFLRIDLFKAKRAMLFRTVPTDYRKARRTKLLPKRKRRKLLRMDMVAAQSLNLVGRSVLADVPLDLLWDVISQGDNTRPYNTEFADEEPFRRGDAILGTCQAMLAIGELLEHPCAKFIFKDSILSRVVTDYMKIRPSFELLSGGETGSLFSHGREESPSVIDAATKVYEYFRKEDSLLREFVAVVSGDGAFWCCLVADKVARAAIYSGGGNVSKDDFVAAAIARLCFHDSSSSCDSQSSCTH